MKANLVCYGVRDVEIAFFEKLNKHDYNLTLVTDLMNDENVNTAKHADAVMIRGNCKANRKNIEKLASFGVKYLLTRTVGFNHIDLEAAKEVGIKVARVPAYSPNAISELAVTLGMMLLRNTAYTANKTKEKDFTVDAVMFSKEIRNCTVGILGTGKIGLTTAKLFKGLGARVVAFDVFESESAKEVVEFLPLDEVLASSDLVSVHVPYIKGQNYKMINEEFLGKMKNEAILINTSRGELQDNEAILKAIEENTIAGFGTDVFEGESTFFFKNLKNKSLPSETIEKLMSYFPRVLVTPHIGSYTDEALTNMVEISYENLYSFLTDGVCQNEVA
ncbi:lactate dehydrogenase [Bacillus pseudomycoides]|uniref:Lactate dehydrogenase n=1 Tax=Bacillus pseudomycoides TaxID=64104 RepID=A0AA91VA88_9BACI|nr:MULTISPECIES: 2-hydroxyacid dehydrogenase [Bacillus]PEB52165.1 lactate dehydrogenase [Bacillus sp. AFS098217]PED81450.1 lactate dehydrogenase [Bacillus pseudomycoides]PEU11444.1 lactate dehydrogenase [Bacillus sp. AFS019443]PEU21608.1 lactate dehydrogenase [Bacillus sp. AFS014408]PFW58581.1 lactate dehydrogenase [Bacillus sp. AFS075034]